jgi:7-cyano-7-deazaguanine synthase
MTTKALVILSGGQDSTTCLFWAKEHFDEVHAVTYNYGQKHAIEIDSAKKVIEMSGVTIEGQGSHTILDVGPILVGSSPLVSRSHQLEQYADMYSLPGGLEKTFVPGRNLLFLTLAANLAYSLGITTIVTGVCQEDFGGYPDCRDVFIKAAQQAIRLGFGYDDNDPFSAVEIATPLMFLSKAASCTLAKALPGCWEAMAYTHTAYDGAYPPVGNDHATLLRAKGFFEANLPDPLVVRAVGEGLMNYPETTNYDVFRPQWDASVVTQPEDAMGAPKDET